jgi:hypothetical protein
MARTMARRVCARIATRTTMQLSSLVRTGTASKPFATNPRSCPSTAQRHPLDKSVSPIAKSTIFRRSVAIVVAGALGAASGALAASLLPADQFAWLGLALLPLFLLLESLLKYVLFAFNDDPGAARMWLAGAILVCFYAAWSLLRSP